MEPGADSAESTDRGAGIALSLRAVPYTVAAVALLGACGGARTGGDGVRAPAPSPPPAAVPSPAPASVGDSLPEPGRLTRPPSARGDLDVRHYRITLDLRRMANSLLGGRARLRLAPGSGADSVRLDLVGLEVDSARLGGRRVPHRHTSGVVALPLPPGGGEFRTVELFYHGGPRDGMVFGTDRHGDALAFADNWPNRARWWFPSNDHPSDKATVRFDVRVPEGWEVVANGGLRSGPTRLEEGGVRWVWETEVPIPTYTMVVGAARFARASLQPAACGRAPVAPGRCVESSVWALPGDSAYGVERFRRAPDMLDFYARRFGLFPYEKLAHVESGTRFGGMENASAIFYARRPWAERKMGEGVIAHEIVHQWYGDSVTPERWRHLWLSEGFATYFAAVYFGAREGDAALRRRLADAAEEIRGSDATHRPVIDSTPDLYSLLNTNSYQKGAWVLHGLRGVVGDSAFFRGVRRFWRRHRDGNASTADFRRVMEEVSGRDLGWFFDQWLRRPGYPRLDAEWWRERDGGLAVAVRQTQPTDWPVYRLPTELEIRTAGGRSVRREVTVDARVDTLRVPREDVPDGALREVRLDPGGWILKELETRRRVRDRGRHPPDRRAGPSPRRRFHLHRPVSPPPSPDLRPLPGGRAGRAAGG